MAPASQSYSASSMTILEGLAHVRKRPGMYIGGTGVSGLHHLVWEVVDNSVDEAMAGFCDRIDITILADGACRVVQTSKDPGSAAYFDLRLAVHRIDGSPDWVVEIMDRGLPGDALTALSFEFDGEVFDLPAGAWSGGDFDYGSAVDTVTIRDPDLAFALVERMKAGNRVIVRYAPAGEGDGQAVFSLRGATAAMNAIEARVLVRQE